MRVCWLVPNDAGGGIVSTALSCCRQAAASGADATLLIMRPPTGWVSEFATMRVETLDCTGEARDAPPKLKKWLDSNPQDVLFLNGCGQTDVAIPYLPHGMRVGYVVHDTASIYWRNAIRYESQLDAIVAVSNTVADTFGNELSAADKLHVIHNGTLFPAMPDPAQQRTNDLLFLGGDKAVKGAHDVVELWPRLIERGFEGQLHWFGEISPGFEEVVAELPQKERIVLHGRANRSVIFDVAASSKVLLVVSRAESFGMATVECMGMGVIPVAWDIATGTREIIQRGETGFFARVGAFDRLADATLDALERHENLADRAIRSARMNFGEETMWRNYRRLIGRLLKDPPAARPHAGETPPAFEPPTRIFQLLPQIIQRPIRALLERSPKIGYWLRNYRGI